MTTVSSSTWPPSVPTSVTQVIPAYAYGQYVNDDNVAAFFTAFNIYAQAYVTWFNALNLPIYTQAPIAGALLDWVVTSLYGYPRPALPSSIGSVPLAPVNTFTANSIPVNGFIPGLPDTFTSTSDDVYRRLVTWMAYKGDGKVFNPRWIKRRINRFLNGVNGTDVLNDTTYNVSVAPTGFKQWTIKIPISAPDALWFESAVLTGAIELPFQIQWTVELI